MMVAMRSPVLLAAAALLLSGCTAPAAPGPDAAAEAGPSKATTADLAEDARRRLDGLTETPRASPRDSYERDAFGSAWSDTDGNGCNQRDDVLLRDAVLGTVAVQPQGRCDHDVVAGTWIDPYTGRALVLTDLKDPAQAQAVQIDHVVALSEAWVSGADGWSDERRREFANDLAALLAVDGPTNASKGDTDPAGWRPKKEFQCGYAVRWIGIKAAWDLAVDSSERRALEEMLGYC